MMYVALGLVLFPAYTYLAYTVLKRFAKESP